MAQVEPNSRLRGCDWPRACNLYLYRYLLARASKCCTMQRGQAHCKLPRYFVLRLPAVWCAQGQSNWKEPEENSFIFHLSSFSLSSSSLLLIHQPNTASPSVNHKRPKSLPQKRAKRAKKWWTIRDFKCETGCGTHAQYGVWTPEQPAS